MNTFPELPLSSLLLANLAKHGFVEPTPVQAEAIPPALAGRDIMATAQTGTGKTLAFVLPMLQMLTKDAPVAGVSAVILTPTRELAIQINETFVKLASGSGIRAAVVVGGLSEQTQLQAIRRGARVLIATPGRLCDFLQRSLVKLGGVRQLVLDEADRMLDMGFLPAIQAILKTLPAVHQKMYFSATIETSVARLIQDSLKDPVRVAIGSMTAPVSEIELQVYEVEQDRKVSLLRNMLQELSGSFLVFARTKHGADRLAKKLTGARVNATSIHGGRSQAQRNRALRGFQDREYRVLVATDVAARGIHVEDIAHVVNYDLPAAPEDFIHRAGRTGRAGASGTATTFATPSERGEVRRIERALNVRITRLDVPAGLEAESRHTAGPVIAIPLARPGSRQYAPRRRAR
jgi:ATP-dependent RNA helicase RhlE